MFPGAHHLVFNHSQFIDQQADAGPTGIDTLREAANPDAAHDSSARDPPPQCFPGTREQLIEDTVHWAVPTVGTDDPLPLFWMKGPAGVGKSAVAQTCVGKLKDMGRLGAAFFFAVRTRDKAAQFFPTIIYQLCSEFPDYRDLVDRLIRRDRTILNKTMATQFRVLIVEPLQELERKGKGIGKRIAIFIDGLDECESANAQCEIIRIIATAARDGTTPFCWAFFSRPEAHIEGTFAIPDIIRITATSVLPVSHDADGDIELYLRSSFENILRRRNISLMSQWPSDDDIRTLVHAANGLFVYVATAVRFIAQPGSLPDESLHEILATISNQRYKYTAVGAPRSPFVELDAFYMLIMERIPPDILLAVLLFLSETKYAPSVIYISNMLGFPEVTFKAVYNYLNAVVGIRSWDDPPPTLNADVNQPFQFADRDVAAKLKIFIQDKLGGSIFFYHKSFNDFLADPSRSGSFCVESSATQNALFKRLLKVYLKYEDSYYIQGSELVLAPGVPDSASSLSYPHTNELVNSLLKATIFYRIQRRFIRSSHNLCLSQKIQNFGQDADFCKIMYLEVALDRFCIGQGMLPRQGTARFISGTRIFQYLSHDLCQQLLYIDQDIAELQQAGIIRPCDPSCVSSFMSLFPAETRDQSITGLYHIGYGSKSIFWFLEINIKSGFYREAKTADLAEGGRIYRAQRFDLWPPYEDGSLETRYL